MEPYSLTITYLSVFFVSTKRGNMSKAKQAVIYTSFLAVIVLIFTYQQNSNIQKQDEASQRDAHNAITEIVRDLDNLGVPEFVGVKVNETKISVDIWISSEPSKELWTFMQGFDVRGKYSPVVRLHRSPFALNKLKEAEQKIGDLVKNSQIEGGVVLSSFGHRQDGTGIDLTLDVSSANPDSKWVSNLEQFLGVPVFVDPEKTDIELL